MASPLTPDREKLEPVIRTKSQPVMVPETNRPGYNAPLSSDQQTQTDTIGQVYRGSAPIVRLAPLPASANPAANAAANSAATVIVQQAIAAQTTSTSTSTKSISLNKQVGADYTVQLSDLNTLISMTNNSGGVVVLPITKNDFQYVQTAGGGGTSGASVTMTNFTGTTLLLTGFTSPNVTLNAQTVADTQGNTWTLLETCSASSQVQTLWVAYNVKGGSNTITLNQAFTPPTPPPDQIPFFTTITVDEMAGIISLDQIGQGAASASVTPTVLPNVVYCTARATADSSALTQPAGWTKVPFPTFSWNYPAYDGGGPGGVINGIDEYILNQPTGASVTGTATGTYISDCNVITADFKTQNSAGTVFPYGWYCYVENTSTADYIVQSLAQIDGVVQSIILPPNSGALFVSDGTNWWTDRGIGGAGGVTSLNTLAGDLTLAAGANITITPSGGNTLTFVVSSGSGVVSGTNLLNFPAQIPQSLGGGWNGYSIAVKMPGRGLLALPTSWKIGFNVGGSGNMLIAGAVVYSMLRDSTTITAVTAITWGSSSTPTLTPGEQLSDAISLTLVGTNDYWIVVYIDPSSSNSTIKGFNTVQDGSLNSSGVLELTGGYTSGNHITQVIGNTVTVFSGTQTGITCTQAA